MAQEKNFENKVKAYLDDRNAWYIKYWAGAKFTKEGIPDLLVCDGGSFVAIEVKADNGRPKLLQLVKLAQIQKAGGYGLLLYPQDFNDFKIFMDKKNHNDDFYLKNLELQKDWKVRLMKEE